MRGDVQQNPPTSPMKGGASTQPNFVLSAALRLSPARATGPHEATPLVVFSRNLFIPIHPIS